MRGRKGWKGWNKEESEAAIEVVTVNFGTQEGERIGTGQARAAQLEEGRQPGSAQMSPMSNAADGGFTSEFGQDDQGQDGSEGVAAATALARVGKGLEQGEERSRLNGVGARGKHEGGQKRGRVHEQSFPARWLRLRHLPL